MDGPAILAKVRDGELLDREEIDYFAQGLADGKVTDSQAAAFAMAVCLKGLSEWLKPQPLLSRFTYTTRWWGRPFGRWANVISTCSNLCSAARIPSTICAQRDNSVSSGVPSPPVKQTHPSCLQHAGAETGT